MERRDEPTYKAMINNFKEQVAKYNVVLNPKVIFYKLIYLYIFINQLIFKLENTN